MAKIPQSDVQARAATYVDSVFHAYEEKMMPRKSELLEIYETYATFKEKKNSNWSTSFKINKAHEVIEKVLPSLTAKDPRWVVSIRNVKAFNDPLEIAQLKEQITAQQGAENIVDIDNVVMAQKQEKVKEHAEAIQDYLTYLFEEYSLMDRLELYGKNGIADGKGYCEIKWNVEKAFVPQKVKVLDEQGNEVKDEEGHLMYRDEVEAVVTGEYPTIDVIDWTDVYYDARYININDRPAFIRMKEGVRLADLLRYKDRYFNLDQLIAMARTTKAYNDDREGFKNRVMQIAGVQDNTQKTKVDENSLLLKYYYGYFSHTENATDEKLYKIVTVNGSIVIQMQEITFLPIEEWKCFPNGKDAGAVGFVEPILGLQDELNFKKNSASEFINKALQRQRVWSPNSGIAPNTLNDPIIPTTKDGQTAIQNIPEVPFQTIGSDYFNEGNDFERQIQSATHTIDTANPRTQNALTDTATGAKIKFYESNKVIDGVRKRFERSLERLAYKLIQCAFDNMKDNIIFKKTGSEGYWHMNKEVLRDALNKYQIKVEVASSSYTDLEDRRDEAIAWFNMLSSIDAKLAESGSPRRVDFIPVLEEIGATFEKKDPMKFLAQPGIPNREQIMSGGVGATPQIKPQPRKMGEAEQVTRQVAGAI